MSNMVVATNVMALNSHRSLKGVGGAQSRAAARLSSGFRINSAADDAAGLAISEKMRAQIRGLDQASRNSQDAISLIQTAEGGMQEVNDMLIRIRTLLVQASNDTNENNRASTGDRQKIQDEIDQLVAEIDSMANRVEFNKKALISGDFADPRELVALRRRQVAAARDDVTDALATNANARQSLLAANTEYDTFTGGAEFRTMVAAMNAYFTNSAANELRTAHANALNDLRIAFEGVAVFEDMLAQFSMDQLAAVNTTDLAAAITAASVPGGAPAGSVVNVQIGDGVDEASGVVSISVSNLAAVQALQTAAAAYTAARAALDAGAGGVVELRDAANSALAEFGATTGNAQFRNFHYNSNRLLMLDAAGQGDSAEFLQTETALQVARNAFLNTTHELRYNELALNVRSGLSAVRSSGIELDVARDSQTRNERLLTSAVDLNARTVPNSLYFQIGANAFQSLELSIGSVGSDFLGIGDGFGNTNLDVVRDSGRDITVQINTLDEALSYIGTERSKLGAAQNRLEHTIRSLDISSENLSASESRIRDADMAREMMAFTQANVLQQAAISMLAQANQAPQNILQLL